MLFTHVPLVQVILGCVCCRWWTAGEGSGESGKVEEAKAVILDVNERRSCRMKVKEDDRMTQINGKGMRRICEIT